MNTLLKSLMRALTACCLFTGAFAASGSGEHTMTPAVTPPRIQMAILLDTSNSMDGLIDQARSQLWRVVNEFALVKKGQQRPALQVALYEYGKPTLPAEQGFIRQVLPFTDDLDRVSEELFALKTNGGDEYCGAVIRKAVDQLAWSASPGDLKTIFIAGNEPFTQGPVDYHVACRAAAAKGITVNTIHCAQGNPSESADWRNGALLADGSFTPIDQNLRAEHIPAPQDPELERLGAELNKTYVPFGSLGSKGAMNQVAQDANAKAVNATTEVQRVAVKASAHYKNASWDLVDARRDAAVDLANIKDEELPKEMRSMDAAARKAYLDGKERERTELQARIRQLDVERAKYVEAQIKQKSMSGAQTLDSAIIGNVRKQAEKKQFVFDK
jgi:hypothetical protein